MAAGGRVKGVSFIRTIALVQGLVERGLVSQEALTVQLSPAALALLDQKIEPSLWYPLAEVDELSRLLVDIEGHGDPDYMRGVGAGALGTLLERDTFRSFIEGAMRQKEGGDGKTLVQLAGLIYDFGRWHFEGDDLRRFVVVMEDAEALPDVAAQTAAGFIEALVLHCTGDAVHVEAARPDPGRVVWTATPA
jgi:hypothetical protein